MGKKLSSALLLFLISIQFCFSQELDDMSNGSYRDAFTKSTFEKLDENKNGSFEKNENERSYKRFKYLDVNKDDIISFSEFKLLKINYLNTNTKRMLNVCYKNINNQSLYLDIYYPTNTSNYKNLPTVIYTHGGGWAAGNKQLASSFEKVTKGLLENGFCVVSVNYRLWTKNGEVAMRDCVIDSKDAVRYLSKYSKELGLNPEKFYAFGDSAGGQIAQMMLLTPSNGLAGDKELSNYSYNMVAGVSWYGPVDFEKIELFNHDDRPNFKDRFGPRILYKSTKPENKLQYYREMSPINYLTKSSPDLLLIQGNADTTIPVKHAYYMQDRAKKINATVDILIVKNSKHNWREAKPDVAILPSKEEIIEKTIKYFVSHL